MRRLSALLVASCLVLAVARPSAQKLVLADILRAGAEYVTQYSDRLQAVGAEEDYLQLEVSGGRTRVTRRLLSDVVFVGVGFGRVVAYRDIYKRDGNALRDREPRLLPLFQTADVAEPLFKAQDLTADGVRHYVSQNVGLFDEMLAPLALLRTENETKVRFKLEGIKTTGGVPIATLRFAETTAPHVINSPINDPASGRILLEAGTGVVRQTELVIANKNVNLRVTMVYALDPALTLWLPSRMTFQSDISSVGAGDQAANRVEMFSVRESLEGQATYSKFTQVPFKMKVR